MTKPPAEQRDWPREYAKIIAKAWASPEFAERLRANPVEVLRSEGIDVPERTKVVDLSAQASPDDYFIVVPPRPESLDDDVWNLVSTQINKAGFGICTGPTVGARMRARRDRT